MSVAIQHATQSPGSIPRDCEIKSWINSVFAHVVPSRRAVTLRVVDCAEIQALNRSYRGKDAPTNVLAFPFEPVADIKSSSSYLGDIVVCIEVVKTESQQQCKSLQSHFAHIVIHGALHLCGFDHQTDEQAAEMEAVERLLLKNFGLLSK